MDVSFWARRVKPFQVVHRFFNVTLCIAATLVIAYIIGASDKYLSDYLNRYLPVPEKVEAELNFIC